MFDDKFYDNVEGFERFLNLPKGSLTNIPIYARRHAINAIIKVREMEQRSLFRSGLYYVVLADLCGNTLFNEKYGNREADKRVQWFHTAAIESIGQIEIDNYVTFNKAIGDASLLIFTSFNDIVKWSNKFTENLDVLSHHYSQTLDRYSPGQKDAETRIEDFHLRGRRLIHCGEVRYVNRNDPLSLAVSQTFKIEKDFSETDLGCTEVVAKIVEPVLKDLKLRLCENRMIRIPGIPHETMSYYIRP